MATVLTPARNLRTLATFALSAAPMLWQRIAKDRKRVIEPAPLAPRFADWTQDGLHAAWVGSAVPRALATLTELR